MIPRFLIKMAVYKPSNPRNDAKDHVKNHANNPETDNPFNNPNLNPSNSYKKLENVVKSYTKSIKKESEVIKKTLKNFNLETMAQYFTIKAIKEKYEERKKRKQNNQTAKAIDEVLKKIYEMQEEASLIYDAEHPLGKLEVLNKYEKAEALGKSTTDLINKDHLSKDYQKLYEILFEANGRQKHGAWKIQDLTKKISTLDLNNPKNMSLDSYQLIKEAYSQNKQRISRLENEQSRYDSKNEIEKSKKANGKIDSLKSSNLYLRSILINNNFFNKEKINKFEVVSSLMQARNINLSEQDLLESVNFFDKEGTSKEAIDEIISRDESYSKIFESCQDLIFTIEDLEKEKHSLKEGSNKCLSKEELKTYVWGGVAGKILEPLLLNYDLRDRFVKDLNLNKTLDFDYFKDHLKGYLDSLVRNSQEVVHRIMTNYDLKYPGGRMNAAYDIKDFYTYLSTGFVKKLSMLFDNLPNPNEGGMLDNLHNQIKPIALNLTVKDTEKMITASEILLHEKMNDLIEGKNKTFSDYYKKLEVLKNQGLLIGKNHKEAIKQLGLFRELPSKEKMINKSLKETKKQKTMFEKAIDKIKTTYQEIAFSLEELQFS